MTEEAFEGDDWFDVKANAEWRCRDRLEWRGTTWKYIGRDRWKNEDPRVYREVIGPTHVWDTSALEAFEGD